MYAVMRTKQRRVVKWYSIGVASNGWRYKVEYLVGIWGSVSYLTYLKLEVGL